MISFLKIYAHLVSETFQELIREAAVKGSQGLGPTFASLPAQMHWSSTWKPNRSDEVVSVLKSQSVCSWCNSLPTGGSCR